MKSVMNVMDHSGHSTFEFDAETKAGVSEAMAEFDRLMKAGHTAAKKVGDGKFEVTRKFDQEASEILMMPRLIGG